MTLNRLIETLQALQHEVGGRDLQVRVRLASERVYEVNAVTLYNNSEIVLDEM
jgi:hypothetical protein